MQPARPLALPEPELHVGLERAALGEASVPLQTQDGPAHAWFSPQTGRNPVPEHGPELRDQRHGRLEQQGPVGGAALLEPVAPVVPGELLQEAECLAREAGEVADGNDRCGHVRNTSGTS